MDGKVHKHWGLRRPGRTVASVRVWLGWEKMNVVVTEWLSRIPSSSSAPGYPTRDQVAVTPLAHWRSYLCGFSQKKDVMTVETAMPQCL